MLEALLDTDTLSEVVKAKHPHVLDAARRYLIQYQRLTFFAITYYEVLRGFHLRRANRGLTDFFQIVNASNLAPVSIPILTRAADLWVYAHQHGHSRSDADLIIGATALEMKRTLVTGNTAHFAWMPGLSLADWRVASAP